MLFAGASKKHGDSSVSADEAPQGISVSGAVFECFHQRKLVAWKEERVDNQAYQECVFGDLKEMHENVGTNPMQAPAEVLPSFNQPEDRALRCSFDLPYYKPSTSHKPPQMMGYGHELVSVASVIAPGASCTPLAHSNKRLLEDEATDSNDKNPIWIPLADAEPACQRFHSWTSSIPSWKFILCLRMNQAPSFLIPFQTAIDSRHAGKEASGLL